MRNFVISLVCIIVIICVWACFTSYSSRLSSECISYADALVNEAIQEGDWTAAETIYSNMLDSWDRYKDIAYFFLDARDINEIDCILGKILLYMEAEDVSNSNGEISYLKNKIAAFHQSDTLRLRNIL